MSKSSLREAADQFSEDVAKFYSEMLGADKTVRAKCTCGRNFDWPVPDWNARAKAIETLLSHGYGRPGQQKDESGSLSTAAQKAASEMTPEERRAILIEAQKRLGIEPFDTH